MEKSVYVCGGVTGVCIPEFGSGMGFPNPNCVLNTRGNGILRR